MANTNQLVVSADNDKSLAILDESLRWTTTQALGITAVSALTGYYLGSKRNVAKSADVAELDALRAELEESVTRLTELLDERTNLISQVADLTTARDEMVDRVALLRQQLAASDQNAADLEVRTADLTRCEESANDLRERLASRDREVADLQRTIEEANEDVKSLTAQLRAATTTTDRWGSLDDALYTRILVGLEAAGVLTDEEIAYKRDHWNSEYDPTSLLPTLTSAVDRLVNTVRDRSGAGPSDLLSVVEQAKQMFKVAGYVEGDYDINWERHTYKLLPLIAGQNYHTFNQPDVKALVTVEGGYTFKEPIITQSSTVVPFEKGVAVKRTLRQFTGITVDNDSGYLLPLETVGPQEEVIPLELDIFKQFSIMLDRGYIISRAYGWDSSTEIVQLVATKDKLGYPTLRRGTSESYFFISSQQRDGIRDVLRALESNMTPEQLSLLQRLGINFKS